MLTRVNKVKELVKSGSSIQKACKDVGIGVVTFYKYKKIATPKTKRPTPTLETIITPHTSKAALIIGDAETIASILKGLN